MCVCEWESVCMSVCMNGRVCACLCVCMRAYVHVCV